MGSCITMAIGVAEVMSEEEIGEEVVVGKHESGILLEEGMITGLRNYCSKCKRNIHCHVVVNKETKEADVIMTCKPDCECKCQTHYACKRCGHLHPYGTECTHIDEEPVRDPKAEEVFEELMEKWTKKK